MKCMVDDGGNMLDVLMDHDLYGQIRSYQEIQTLEDVKTAK